MIYEDPKSHKLQNFFITKRKTKKNVEMRILHKGKWEKLHEVIKPFYKMESTTNSTLFELVPVTSKSWHKDYVVNGQLNVCHRTCGTHRPIK